MRFTFSFTASVTDLKTGEREQISETAHFDHPITRADAESAISRELRRQNKPSTGVRITGSN
ncbi:hypothetical protein [Streptomyces sp. NPDC016626]|uniref:hypothetical protein n=1 Tax=Streptomyces sp. NPDC016626 TaxID=3364968 RepID=UPI0036FF78B9